MNKNGLSGLVSLASILSLWLAALTPVPGAFAASSNNPYERGMKAFSSRDFKSSDAFFSQALRSDPSNANAMYMDALSLQQLGNKEKATALFKSVLAKFPDSAACIRSQDALMSIDPVFVRRWKIANPPRVTQMGIGPLEGKGISPDFAYGIQPLSVSEQKYQEKLLVEGRIIDARINGVWTKIQYVASQPYSYLGFNFLQEANQRFSKSSKTVQTQVLVDKVRLGNFEFHTVAKTGDVIKVGRDFEAEYRRIVAMANPVTATRYLTARNTFNKAKTGENKIDAADDQVKPNEERFDIHYTNDQDGHKIITVQLNGSSVDMIYGESSGMLMGPEQVRNIDPNLLGDLKAETVGGTTVRNAGTVTWRTVACGLIVRYQVPCRVEGYTGLRNPTDGSSPRNLPLLGSDFFANWTTKIDDDRKIIRVSRIKPGT